MKKVIRNLFLSTFLIFSIGSYLYAQVNVSLLANLEGEVGDTDLVAVTIGDITGENVISFGGDLTCDTSVIDIVDIQTSGTISDDFDNVGINYIARDNIYRIGGYGSESVSGSGTLVYLVVEFKAAGTTTLAWDSFTFNDGDPAANITGSCQITVNSGPPELNLESNQIDFGDIPVDDTSSDSLKINNNGEGLLIIDSINVNDSSFQYELDTTEIDPGGETSLKVDFAPLAAAEYSGNLVLYTNDGTASIDVSGRGIKAILNLSKDNINFGMVNTNEPITKSFYVINEGNTELTIDSVSQELNSFDVNFSQASVMGDDSVKIEVTFTPAQTATYNDTLFVNTSAGNDTVMLEGIGVERAIELTKMHVDLGDIYVNETTSDSFYVKNEGSAAVEIDSAVVTGNEFNVNISKNTITTNDSSKISISFDPNQKGLKQEMAIFYTNAGIDTLPVIAECLNSSPVFSSTLPDTTINNDTTGTAFTFNYTASDLNEDDLSFGLVNPITGLSMSASGELSWDPIPEQPVNPYEVVVSLTDGDTTVYDTTLIEVEDVVGISLVDNSVPDKYSLNQNYPNPFNPTTSISFDLPKKNEVVLKIYDLNGQLVEKVNYGSLSPGRYHYQFNASNFSSGVFFYKLEADNFVDIKKMTLIK